VSPIPQKFRRWRGRIAILGAVCVAASAVYVTTTLAAPGGDGGELLSQGKPATSSSNEIQQFNADAAVDGDPGTRWSSAFADPQWLQIDLGSDASISRVVLNWERAYAKSYQIQTSGDGSGWTTVHNSTAGPGGVENLTINASGRYVRLKSTARSTQYGVSLWEFQVFGTAGTPAPTTTVTPPETSTSAPSSSAPTSTTAPTKPSTPTSTTAAPPKGPLVRVAEFVAECPFTHALPDDPIVFPKLPGASHLHSFFGNETTNASSDIESLKKGRSTCSPSVDISSYWVPSLLVDGKSVEPTGTTFYYLGEGVRDDVIAQTQPLPYGLRIVAGNAKATAPDDSSRARWSCLHAGDVGSSKDFVNCPAGTMLESYLDFPQCWNGKDLDSADHKSHMSYPVNGGCPSTHPVPVPKLRQVLRYPASGDPSHFKLASGPGYTMHGDFFNAWPEAEMARRVNDCIRPIIKCGPSGTP
jgi:uncharacterized protein DUF1996/F5/8 type C domain-containing protein